MWRGVCPLKFCAVTWTWNMSSCRLRNITEGRDWELGICFPSNQELCQLSVAWVKSGSTMKLWTPSPKP